MTAPYIRPISLAETNTRNIVNNIYQLTNFVNSHVASYTINVKDFGATGDGVTDDTASIQSAINSLPFGGGQIIFPTGVYLISSTLTIGNGSASAQSTVNGVYLAGSAGPSVPIPSNLVTYQGTAGVIFKASSSFSGSEIVSVLGPIQGWGLSNIFFDGGGSASSAGTIGVGLLVTSGQFGFCQNLSFLNFTVAGLYTNTWSSASGTGVGNCQQNIFINTTVRTPTADNAKGFLISGDTSGAVNDTAYCTFIDTFIALNEAANTHVNFGISLDISDSCTFVNTHIVGGSGGNGAGNVGIELNYSVNSSFPNSHTFYGLDAASSATFRPINIDGSPAADVASHQIFGATRGNNMPAPYAQTVAFYSDIASRQTPIAFSMLPAAASTNQGARAIVNNSVLPSTGNFGSIVTTSTSTSPVTNVVPVWSDGSNWRIG